MGSSAVTGAPGPVSAPAPSSASRCFRACSISLPLSPSLRCVVVVCCSPCAVVSRLDDAPPLPPLLVRVRALPGRATPATPPPLIRVDGSVFVTCVCVWMVGAPFTIYCPDFSGEFSGGFSWLAASISSLPGFEDCCQENRSCCHAYAKRTYQAYPVHVGFSDPSCCGTPALPLAGLRQGGDRISPPP